MDNLWKKLVELITRFKGLTILGSASGIVNVMGAIFWFFMASILGASHYGEITYSIAIASIAAKISLLGSANTIMVYSAKGVKIQPPMFFISIIASFIASMVLFFVFLTDISVSLYAIGFVVFTLVTSDLLGRKYYSLYAKYLILQKSLLVVLAVGLYYIIGVEGVILGIALSFFPFGYIIFKEFKDNKLDFSVIKNRYRFITNNYLLDLSDAFVGSLDKIIILPIIGFVLLGNYQLGIQFFALLTILPNLVYQYTLPHDATGNSNKLLKKMIIILAVIISLLSIFLAPILVPGLFPEYSASVEIIQIISMTVIPATITVTYISKFLGMAKSSIVLISSGIYLAVQIPSLIIFTNLYGVNGAAAAIVLSYTIQAIYFIIVDRKFKNFESNLNSY